jgi:zinc protease
LREDLAGTYGVSVGASYGWRPISSYTVSISFGSDPERAAELADVVFDQIAKLKEAAPDESEVADVRENFLRTYETSIETNGYWVGELAGLYARDADPEAFLTYPASIEAVTPAMIQEAARLYFDTENFVRVTLLPVEQDPAR